MPSPVGHALGGVLFGWVVEGRRSPEHEPARYTGVTAVAPLISRRFLRPAFSLRSTLTFAFLGMLADIDFLFGMHSRQTHSIGAAIAVLVVVLAWQLARPGGPAGSRTLPASAFRFALACAGAYGSHVLFDWMGNDTTPPIGIMALWPLTDGFYQSNLYVFEAISRRYALPGFWSHNLLAVLREVLIVGPLVLAMGWWRQRASRG